MAPRIETILRYSETDRQRREMLIDELVRARLAYEERVQPIVKAIATIDSCADRSYVIIPSEPSE